MATPTVSGFKARFPEFEALGISDPTIQACLDDAIDHLNEESWGSCYERAVYYYTAHTLTINQRRTEAVIGAGLTGAAGTAGPVTSSGADGLSVSFAAPKASEGDGDDWYRQTSYGQEYLALGSECLSTARAASC
jgi:hypothetical protein